MAMQCPLYAVYENITLGKEGGYHFKAMFTNFRSIVEFARRELGEFGLPKEHFLVQKLESYGDVQKPQSHWIVDAYGSVKQCDRTGCSDVSPPEDAPFQCQEMYMVVVQQFDPIDKLPRGDDLWGVYATKREAWEKAQYVRQWNPYVMVARMLASRYSFEDNKFSVMYVSPDLIRKRRNHRYKPHD